ncbi:unnamed protein product [Bursaphelenchus okinawaensis]|uniref:Uncharacterized protein n=1 Tax=Bursaphelenchus okinawaensis TaxID=465554 RepID=A0A811JWX3_9BILA|nr:unnamed protein product [Bursaphelenchus okinawaensis]CAG9086675.1 unnamed protein product [Bursaphelenchus okinawaensis]
MERYGRQANVKDVINFRVVRPVKLALAPKFRALGNITNNLRNNIKSTAIVAGVAIKVKAKKSATVVSKALVEKTRKLEDKIEVQIAKKEAVKQVYPTEYYAYSNEKLIEVYQQYEARFTAFFEYYLLLVQEQYYFFRIAESQEHDLYQLQCKKNQINLETEQFKELCKNVVDHEDQKLEELKMKKEEKMEEVTDLHNNIDNQLETFYEVLSKIVGKSEASLKENALIGHDLITKQLMIDLLSNNMTADDVLNLRVLSQDIQQLRSRTKDCLAKRSANFVNTSPFFAANVIDDGYSLI